MIPKRLLSLAGITGLAGLLAAFLILKTHNRGPRPAGESEGGPAGNGTVEEAEDPSAAERSRLVEEIRAAVERGELEEAWKRHARLKALGPSEEAEALENRIREAERKREIEAERQAEEEFAREHGSIQEMHDRFLWQAAATRLEELERRHPVLGRMPEFRRVRDRIREQERDAGQHFMRRLEEARTELEGQRYPRSIELAEEARSVYPERRAESDPLAREALRLHHRSSMVFIPSLPEELPWKIGEPGSASNPERPYRRGDFFMDATEVTNEQYELFVRMTRREPPPMPYWKTRKLIDELRSAGKAEEARALELRLKSLGRLPVTGVTHSDARAYAEWAGKRLPTAEEWEAAARWLDGRRYPWGNDFQPAERTFRCNSLEYGQSTGRPAETAAGLFADGQSPYGVFDLAGNVWEWTATTRVVESDGSPRTLAICKGGSYLTPARLVQAWMEDPEDPDLAHFDVGFRCVRDPE